MIYRHGRVSWELHLHASKCSKKPKGNGRGTEKRRWGRGASLISCLRAPVMELRHLWKPHWGIVVKNEAFWHLTLKVTTKIKEYKSRAIKWRQDERDESSCVVIRHSVWSVSLLEKNRYGTLSQRYSLSGCLQEWQPPFFDVNIY